MMGIFKTITNSIIVGVISGLLIKFILRTIEKLWNIHLSEPTKETHKITEFLVPILFVLIMFFSESRWALNILETGILILCALFICTILLILLLLSIRRNWYPQIVKMIIFVVLIVGFYLADKAMPKYLRYHCPAVVHNAEMIQGRVSNFMKNYYLYSVIYSDQGIGWIQEITTPDQKNLWSSHIRFGGRVGENYKLMVYASKYDLELTKTKNVSEKDFIKPGVYKGSSCNVVVRKTLNKQ